MMTTKTSRRRFPWGIVLLASLAITSQTPARADAAALTFGSATQISNNGGNFNISVFDGAAAYGGLANGTFGDGTVEAYAFFSNVNGGIGAGPVSPIVRYADGGGSIVSTPTIGNTTTTGDTFANARVFTNNDPGVAFAGTPNFNTGTGTISGAHNVNGTIDVSGFTSGTAYFLVGYFDNLFDVSLSLTGTGQSTLNAIANNIDPPANRNMYVVAFDFDNADLLYDQISYQFVNDSTATANASNRSRFMGVIVNGVTPAAETVPEPAAVVLWCAIGLGAISHRLLRARRK